VKLLTGLRQGGTCGIRVWTHLFDRADAALQAEILRTVYGTHPPLPNDRHDFIPPTQDGLWFKQTSQGVASLPFLFAGDLSSSLPLIIDEKHYSVKEVR
jgi:hypothetical protein